jgi:hypothetical protein
LDKTWIAGSSGDAVEFKSMSLTGGTSLLCHQAVLWGIKDALTRLSSNPWTVVSSCDALSTSVGSDLWVDSLDLIWLAEGSAHSWIVLQQSNINAKFQVCLDLNSTDIHGKVMSIVVSPAAGFGVANGGTAGTTLTRPTALDQHILLSSATWLNGETEDATYVVTVLQSTDGQCTRVMSSGDGAGVCSMYMAFERPKDPITGWTNPCIYAHISAGTASRVLTYTKLTDDSLVGYKATLPDYNGVPFKTHLQLAGHFYSGSFGTQIIDKLTLADPDVILVMSHNAIVASTGTRAEGEMGSVFDFYWISDNEALVGSAGTVDTLPANGDRTFVCPGHCAIGWLDDASTDLVF